MNGCGESCKFGGVGRLLRGALVAAFLILFSSGAFAGSADLRWSAGSSYGFYTTDTRAAFSVYPGRDASQGCTQYCATVTCSATGVFSNHSCQLSTGEVTTVSASCVNGAILTNSGGSPVCTGGTPDVVCPAAGTSKGDNRTEVFVDRMSIDMCEMGCGWTAAGAATVMGSNPKKYLAFGPYVATGTTCTPTGGSNAAVNNTVTDKVPDSRCSARNPTTGVCEAACRFGEEYRQVPTGAFACVKTDTSIPDPPKDTSCPRGYMNISVTSTPNCAPTGGLGNMTASGPASCPAGQHSVTNNGGASYCVFDTEGSTSKSTTNAPSTVTNNADGTTTKKDVATRTNSDGSTTTETTTTTLNPDGSVKVQTVDTVVGKRADGTQGTSDSGEADKYNLCKQNPNLNICKNSSVTGACSSLKCDGDAVACSIWLAQARKDCDLANDPAGAEAEGFKKLSDYGDGVDNLNKDGKKDVDAYGKWQSSQSSVSSKLSMFTGGASCPAPMSVQVAFAGTAQTIGVPFDILCSLASVMRMFVIVAAGMVSLRIMFRINSV